MHNSVEVMYACQLLATSLYNFCELLLSYYTPGCISCRIAFAEDFRRGSRQYAAYWRTIVAFGVHKRVSLSAFINAACPKCFKTRTFEGLNFKISRGRMSPKPHVVSSS